MRFRRNLYIDTSKSGLLENIEDLFVLPFYLHTPPPPTISVFPGELEKNIFNYESEFVVDKGFKIKNGSFFSDLNFSRNYNENIIVYEQCGGGEDSIAALGRLKLRKEIRDHINQVINKLENYDAIHVRNTDMETDYIAFINSIAGKITGRVVVCTDDYRVQQYAKQFFSDKMVIVTDIPDIGGISLHDNPALDRHKTNVESLTDLFILVCASNLFLSASKQNIISGFGKLAMNLHNNRKIVKRLLGGT